MWVGDARAPRSQAVRRRGNGGNAVKRGEEILRLGRDARGRIDKNPVLRLPGYPQGDDFRQSHRDRNGGARRVRELREPVPRLDPRDDVQPRLQVHVAGSGVAPRVKLGGRAVGVIHVQVHFPGGRRLHAAQLVHPAVRAGGVRGALCRDHRTPLLPHPPQVVRQLDVAQKRDPLRARGRDQRRLQGRPPLPPPGVFPGVVNDRVGAVICHLLPDPLPSQQL
mmetsp:Transcript_65547/g.150123  ORF Transcript_65547/g.150123 Transcript_65547/m.150123 type:complete len:222 (-) Transcript_65547:11-676(-)